MLTLIGLLIPIFVILLIVYVHLRVRRGKRRFEARTTFAGQSAVMDLMNQGKRKAMEQVYYENEEEQETDEEGEDVIRIIKEK